MNVRYWQDWFKWAQGQILGFAKRGDLLGLAAFCGDFGTTVEQLVQPFESLSACFKGNVLTVARNLFSWASANRDPLAGFRRAAEAMKTRWATAPTPSPSPAPNILR